MHQLLVFALIIATLAHLRLPIVDAKLRFAQIVSCNSEGGMKAANQ